MDADSALTHFQTAGWSAGEIAYHTADGLVWQVFAHRGDQRIVARANGQTEAWAAAVRMIEGRNLGAR